MFYDVLMKLCQQSIKIYFLGSELKEIKVFLHIVKQLAGGVNHDDMLEAIHQKNPLKKKQYDINFIGLLEMMKEKTHKAELVQEIVDFKEKLKI